MSGCPKDRPMIFGQHRKGKEPIVLLLRKGHYALARLHPGRQWPKEWMEAEPAEVTSTMLRAGAEHDSVHKQQVTLDDLRPPATPSSGTRSQSTHSNPATWRIPATPKSEGLGSKTGGPDRSVSAQTREPPSASVDVSPGRPQDDLQDWRAPNTPSTCNDSHLLRQKLQGKDSNSKGE